MKTHALGIRVALVFAVVAGLSAVAEARPKVPRAILKDYFQSGDKPTAQQFGTLIDSDLNALYDDRHLLGLFVYGSEGRRVKRLGIGDFTPETPVGFALPPSSLIEMAPDFAGQFGFAALRFGDSLGQSYNGFMQLSMDALASGATEVDPAPAIHVQYVVLESTPNLGFATFVVPEPASLGALAIVAAIGRRRR